MSRTPPIPEAVLAATDDTAQLLVSSVAPIELRVARTPEEQDVAFRLRCEAAVARRWCRPEDFPDGRERDQHDPGAIHIVAWDGPTPAGTARLVLPVPGRPLPTEEAFDVRVEPAGAFGDWGRFLASPGHRIGGTPCTSPSWERPGRSSGGTACPGWSA